MSSCSLAVYWKVGPGRTEQFRIVLMDKDGVLLRNVSLRSTETSAELSGLQPGTRYTVTVVTEAVGLQTSVSTQAVTGTYYGINLKKKKEKENICR